MTCQDILLQILSEVTGLPQSRFKPAIEMSKALCLSHQFDEELSPAEAEKLLKELRQEKAGILNWMIGGAVMANRNLPNRAKRN
jgi:hypothetical protein